MKLDEATLTALRDEARELAKSATAVLVGLSSGAAEERIAKAARRIAELAGCVPTDVAASFDVDTQDLEPES